jgi:hypothetical protein
MLALGQLCGYQIIIQCLSSGTFARISAEWLSILFASILGEADETRRAYLPTKYDSQNKYRLFP